MMLDKQNTSADHPVSTIISRRIKAGHEQEFQSILDEFKAALDKHPGFIGIKHHDAGPHTDHKSISVISFAHLDDLLAWESSEKRKAIFSKLSDIVEGEIHRERLSGVELLAQEKPAQGKWKTVLALIIWITLLNFLLGPLITLIWPVAWPLGLKSIVMTTINVSLISYLLLPWTMRLLKNS